MYLSQNACMLYAVYETRVAACVCLIAHSKFGSIKYIYLRMLACCKRYMRRGAAATHGNTLQHTATRCNTLQHTATRCNTLQHAAIRCNTLQHTYMSQECDVSILGRVLCAIRMYMIDCIWCSFTAETCAVTESSCARTRTPRIDMQSLIYSLIAHIVHLVLSNIYLRLCVCVCVCVCVCTMTNIQSHCT